MNNDWIYINQRIISKDGVVLFDGPNKEADDFFDDNNLGCTGCKFEAHTKVSTYWNGDAHVPYIPYIIIG